MTINEIVSKRYDDLLKMVNPDFVRLESQTDEDILQNTILKALRKFKDDDIDEETGMEYITSKYRLEKFFQRKRKSNEKTIYVGGSMELNQYSSEY